jgi:hypothetical protein
MKLAGNNISGVIALKQGTGFSVRSNAFPSISAATFKDDRLGWNVDDASY